MYVYACAYEMHSHTHIYPGIAQAQYAELRGQSHMAHLEDLSTYIGVLDGWLLSVEANREL